MKKIMQGILSKLRDKRAFTLVEMILVLFIVGVLMLLVIPNLSDQRANIETQGNEAFLQTIDSQTALYETIEGGTPTNQQLLEEGYITQEQFAKLQNLNAE